MTVHVDSKIELWVNTFNPTFYASLTDKENWAYVDADTDVDIKTALMDYFQELMDAMNAWKAATHPGRSASTTKSLINVIYTYRMYGARMGTSITDLPSMDAKSIYDMGGFMATTIARPVDYYDDILITTPWTSDKLQADIDSLAPAVWKPIEQGKIDTAMELARAAPMNYNYAGMFEDLPAPTGTPMTKAQLAEAIFIGLNYKFIRDNVPGVAGIVVPSYLDT